MKKILLFVIGVWCQQEFTALAYPMLSPESLHKLVEKSDVICVGQIEEFFPANEDYLLIVGPDGKKKIDFDGIVKREGQRGILLLLSRVQAPGIHRIRALQYLKGKESPSLLSFHTPSITSRVYESSEFRAKKGDRVVAFLRRSPEGKLEVADEYLFFIPISQKIDPKAKDNLDAESIIRQWMIETLNQKEYPATMLYLLRDVKSADMVKAAALYARDADLTLRDKALYSLAVNKQMAAIPLIVEQANAYAQNNRVPVSSLAMLGSYDSVAALPYFEPMLFNKEFFFRYRGITSIMAVADKNSVPFLLMTLLDPEPQKINRRIASRTLSRLTKLPEILTKDGEIEKQDLAFQYYLKWWQDELSGKHPVADEEKPRVFLRESSLYAAKDVPTLNEGLFMRSEFTRGAAIKALDKLADQSSIPYLLLAQYDPKPDIAFGAYKTLHRLIPSLGEVKARPVFEAQREALAQEGFDWWAKHLQDAETEGLPPAAQPKTALPAAK